MAQRSFLGLIRRRGFDERGRTGYQIGEKTELTAQQQYDNAVAWGFNPPPPGGGGGGGSINPSLVIARAAVLDTPMASKLPVTRGLCTHWRAGEPRAYFPRGYPTDGAGVPLLRAVDAREMLIGRRNQTAVQVGANGYPTFVANADGAGRPGLRFTGSLTQRLDASPIATAFNSNDAEVSLFGVFRLGSAPGTRRFFSIFRSAEANSTFSLAALGITAGQFQFFANQNFGANPGTAGLVQTPLQGETFIMFGRHGNNTNGRNNSIWVRSAGATNTFTNTTTAPNLGWGTGAPLDSMLIGGDGRASVWCDDIVFEFAAFNAWLNDTERDNLIAYAQTMHGVA